jgi:hypothetical protein
VRRCGRRAFRSTASSPAAYGIVHAFRTAIDRMGLRYAVGVVSCLTVQVTGVRRRCKGRVIEQLPRRAWRRVAWAQGTKGPLAAPFAALHVHPTARPRVLAPRRMAAHDRVERNPIC